MKSSRYVTTVIHLKKQNKLAKKALKTSATVFNLKYDFSVTLDDEATARKHEPLMFKKYCALKNVPEAKCLITSIHNRQKALQLLEAMTYRKYVVFQNNLKVR